MNDDKKPVGKRQRKVLRTRHGKDAEGTVRLPHIQQALDAGLLNAPAPDRPLGRKRRRG